MEGYYGWLGCDPTRPTRPDPLARGLHNIIFADLGQSIGFLAQIFLEHWSFLEVSKWAGGGTLPPNSVGVYYAVLVGLRR